MISFMIDEITPCLKSNETGEIYETEVIQLKRKSFLTKFNKLKTSTPKYSGVGGHLLAIASELSFTRGFDGYIWGEAINKDIFKYYLDKFSATAVSTYNNPYQFMIIGKHTQKLMEVYNYEWTGEEL